MQTRAVVAAAVFSLGLFATACSSTGGGVVGTGGTTGSTGGQTGAGGSGAGGSCDDLTPCGGSVEGEWTVMSSCLKMTGTLDVSLVGAVCAPRPVTGSLQVSGTFTARANGTYQDDTVTTGQAQFGLDESCLVVSSTPVDCAGAAGFIKILGFDKLTCTAAGKGCNCSGTVNQKGSFGALAITPSTDGNYATANNVLTLTDVNDVKYRYCVAGTKLTASPSGSVPPLSGTIVFQKSGGASTGGAPGTGGGATGGAMTGGASGGGRGGAGGAPRTGGAPGTGAGGGSATGGSAGSSGGGKGPCDIYKSAGNPCVAAHSTVRALLGDYNGKLYQVRNAAGATKDILTLSAGGVADGPSQDAFCTGTTCVVTVVYDQSGKGNDLWYQGSTMVPGSPQSSPAKATTESLTLNGHKVYSLYINAGNSYWVDSSKSGIPLGADPEGMYMVTNSKHYNGGCCFDYGNSETDRKADGSGAMDALNFSSITAWGTGAGNGPWVMADLEYGVFAQNNTGKNASNPTQTSTYVTAVLKNNGKTEFALRGGNAAAGALGTYYKGALPGGWSPMKKQGAIVLGSGGDCCKPSGGANQSAGTFYEGCIVTGYPTDATEDAVQENIVAAGYGK